MLVLSLEGHDIPFRYSAHCAGARRHDWPRRAADLLARADEVIE
jgi:hypothetical protein